MTQYKGSNLRQTVASLFAAVVLSTVALTAATSTSPAQATTVSASRALA